MPVTTKEQEKVEILRRQARDVADPEDGWILVYVFEAHHLRAVDLRKAIALCVAGQASLAEWPRNETE